MCSRRPLWAVLLAALCGPALASTWSDLWSTRDQQAQQQLDANHPSEAAKLFSDPKRRAYAESQAGQYAKAAGLLAPMKDADSQFNRGNALARGGKLEDALKAYDAALATSPGNEDVLRNRDLVTKALEQQQGKGGSGQNGKGQKGQSNSGGQGSSGSGDQQSGGKDSEQGKNGQAAGQSQAGQQRQSGQQAQPSQQGQSGQQAQPGQQSQSAQQAQSGQQGQSAQQAQSGQQGQSAQQGQNANQRQANAQNQPNSSGQAQPGQQNQAANHQQDTNAAGAGTPGQQAQAANPSQNGNSAAANANPTQAQNDQQALAAAANQAKQRNQHDAAALQQGQTSGTGTQRGPANMPESSLVRGGAATDSQTSQPRSEQALALDQWLRSIPDDSGELLRRKFQIEHLMKQQGNQP